MVNERVGPICRLECSPAHNGRRGRSTRESGCEETELDGGARFRRFRRYVVCEPRVRPSEWCIYY